MLIFRYFPARIGVIVAYFELAIGLGQGIGANVGIWLKNLMWHENYAAFFALSAFYFLVIHPLILPIPADVPAKEESND